MAGVSVGDGSYACNFIAAAGGYRVSFDRDDAWVIIRERDGTDTPISVKEHPRVEGLCAAIEEGELIVYLSCIMPVNGDKLFRRDVRLATGKFARPVDPALPMGPKGEPGPKGDKGDPGLPQPGSPGRDGKDAQVTPEIIRAIAEAVWDVPPRADNNGLPEDVRFGKRHQQDIAIMLLNQAFLQRVGMTIDEAAAFLQEAIKNGQYVPKTLKN